MKLLLASASPQRSGLLSGAGVEFEVSVSGVDEVEEGFQPEHIAVVNAEAKAAAVASKAGSGFVVLAADTVVDLNGHALGQPVDEEQAFGFISALAGRTHEVHTAVCVVEGESVRTGVASTRVTFRELAVGEIEDNLRLGEWRGRAGGYAIQAGGANLVERVDGDLDNVVGLPVALALQLLPESVQSD